MDWNGREVVTTGDLKRIGLDLGEFADRLLDRKANAVFCCEVSEHFAKNTITKPVKSPVHDHIVISKSGHNSFKSLGLL